MEDGSVGRQCCHGECRECGRQFATRYGALDCHLLSSFRTQFQARVYSEDGEVRPINVVLETPRGPSTVAVRNIGQVPRAGRDWREAERRAELLCSASCESVCDVVRSGEQMEFPMSAQVDEMYVPEPSPEHQSVAQYIQGGALKTWIQLPGDPDACPCSESPISKSTCSPGSEYLS